MGFPGERGSTPTSSRRRRSSTRRWPSLRSSSAWRRRCPSRARSASCGAYAPTRSSNRDAGCADPVLGVLESAGLEFDALWVSGLTDDVWPMHAKPNPSSRRRCSARRRSPKPRRKRRSSAASASPAAGSGGGRGDRLVPGARGRPRAAAEPTGAGSEAGSAGDHSYPRYRDLIFAARRIETVEDGQAPALATRTPRGGTRILADQAACPFRAFARHRLAAEALEEPVEGLDARARGLLLHTLMKEL